MRDTYNLYYVLHNLTHNLYHVLLSLKRGTVSALNITLLIDYCVNYYCVLLFNMVLCNLENNIAHCPDEENIITIIEEQYFMHRVQIWTEFDILSSSNKFLLQVNYNCFFAYNQFFFTEKNSCILFLMYSIFLYYLECNFFYFADKGNNWSRTVTVVYSDSARKIQYARPHVDHATSSLSAGFHNHAIHHHQHSVAICTRYDAPPHHKVESSKPGHLNVSSLSGKCNDRRRESRGYPTESAETVYLDEILAGDEIKPEMAQ